jgi:hypothetical protein
MVRLKTYIHSYEAMADVFAAVRGLYEYAAQGPDEMAVAVGQLIELSDGPNGGQNYASGWWEGVSSSGKKGIFPSNYVELA